MASVSVHLLTGDDESMLRAAVNTLVQSLVGDGDRSLMVDDFDAEDYTLGAVVDAAHTAPFLTERRVVVARMAGRFTADELGVLAGYLADPLPSTELVIEWGGEPAPSEVLRRGADQAGATITSTAPPNRARDRNGWVEEQAKAIGVRLNAAAVALVVGHLGEDVGVVGRGVADVVGDVRVGHRARPRAGRAVPRRCRWRTAVGSHRAIDGGRTSRAIELLGRMLGAGERHPLQVMAILQGHYGKLATLDGRELRTEADAAAALGIKPGYRRARRWSRPAVSGARRSAGRSICSPPPTSTCAAAVTLDSTLVIEILVARLSRLART